MVLLFLVRRDPDWIDDAGALLTLTPSHGKAKGLYLNLLTISALRGCDTHLKAYGGMAAGSKGLDCICHHNNESFRKNHPTFHYMMMDLPGTFSESSLFTLTTCHWASS